MKKTLIALAMALAFAGATVVPYTVAFAADEKPASSTEKPAKKKGKKAKKGEKKEGAEAAK